MNSLLVLVMQILPASMNFVFVYLWMFTVSSAVGDQTFIKRSQWGWSLENASYHQMETNDYPTCLVNCITDKRCRSLTYDLLGKKCKLSGETRWTRPLQYIGNISNSIYMEMVPTADRMLPIASAIPQTTDAPQTNTEPSTIPQTTTQPPTTPQTTTQPPTTFDPSTYCKGKSNGDYLHPTNCSQYITCSNGITYDRACSNAVNSVCPAGC